MISDKFKYLFLKNLLIRIFYLNIFVFFVSVLIYVLNFTLLNNYDNYYLCNSIELINLTIFNSEYQVRYPISCDLYEYIEGIKRFNNIIEYNHSYQTRPVYILAINLISKLVRLFFISESVFIYLISIFIFQINVLILSSYFFLKILNLNYNLRNHNIINTFLIISPIYKWGIFDPAHQTLVFLAFSLSIYLLMLQIKNKNEIFYIFLVLGILYLSNKIFILTFIIFSFKVNMPINSFRGFFQQIAEIKNYAYLLIFVTPSLIYRQYIQYNGFEPYNASVEYWGHFIWIKYFVLGLNNHEGEWYCTTIPENFYCYISDSQSVLTYYSIPLFLVTIYFTIRKLNNKTFILNSISVFGLFYIFWSFIGWYPPLRFNLYSISPFVTLLILYMFFNEKSYINKIVILSLNCLYFLSLKHWNYPGVIDFNFYYFALLTLNLLFFIKLYTDRIEHNE